MIVRALTCLTLGTFLTAAVFAQNPGRNDAEKLKGTWNVVACEKDGKKEAVSATKPAHVVITPESVTVRAKDWTEGMTYRVDPSKRPAAIDFKVTKGEDKGKTAKGIYELTGDELKICFAHPGMERPRDFSTKAGSQEMCFVLKRAAK
jgi:uncharacterized protein (TIGR03067 family)